MSILSLDDNEIFPVTNQLPLKMNQFDWDLHGGPQNLNNRNGFDPTTISRKNKLLKIKWFLMGDWVGSSFSTIFTLGNIVNIWDKCEPDSADEIIKFCSHSQNKYKHSLTTRSKYN